MRNALQDQLLKAGLVNDKQVKKASLEKRKETRQNQGTKPAEDPAEAQRQRQQAQAEKAERDRLLNQQRNTAAEQKAIAAQIKQLVEAHRRPGGDGDTPYHFADDGKVKILHVSEPVRGQIVRGSLAIVKVDQQYALVPQEVAEKIRARNPAAVIVDNAQPQTEKPQENDPYAQYQVPDDLMW